MDHLLYILDCIEELLRELMLAEARGATKELRGFDVIYSLIHGCCELINTSQEGVGLPPLPKTIREKGVYLELEKEVVGGRRNTLYHCLFPSCGRGNSEYTRESP